MPQATVKHNNEEITVDLPDGWISPEQAELYVLEADAKKAQKKLRENIQANLLEDDEFAESILQKRDVPTDGEGHPIQREKLAEDDDLWKKAAEVRGVRLDDKGKPITKEVDLNQYRETWEREKLEPVRKEFGKKVESLTTTNARLLEDKFDSEIVRAGSGYVRKGFLHGGPQGRSKIATIFRNEFAYDDEHGYYAAVRDLSSDGTPNFKVSADPTEAKPYVDAAEFLAVKAKDDDWKHLFEDRRPGEVGLGKTNGVSGGGLHLTREQFEQLSPVKKKKFFADGGAIRSSP